MRLYYKAREGETIQYADVMSLYPYIYKYRNFQWAIRSFMWDKLAKSRKPVYIKRASLNVISFHQRD